MSFQPYPSAPPPPELSGSAPDAIAPPRALRPVVTLLVANLVLSIGLTIAVLIARRSVIAYQLDHRHITDPGQRRLLHDSYSISLWVRVATNIVASVVYVFLVRALLRGRRWAYRRVILLGGVGILGLLIIQATPYPTWMRVEQLFQALVLAGLVYFVTRPEVRSHFDSGLPGRNVRRWRR